MKKRGWYRGKLLISASFIYEMYKLFERQTSIWFNFVILESGRVPYTHTHTHTLNIEWIHVYIRVRHGDISHLFFYWLHYFKWHWILNLNIWSWFYFNIHTWLWDIENQVIIKCREAKWKEITLNICIMGIWKSCALD